MFVDLLTKKVKQASTSTSNKNTAKQRLNQEAWCSDQPVNSPSSGPPGSARQVFSSVAAAAVVGAPLLLLQSAPSMVSQLKYPASYHSPTLLLSSLSSFLLSFLPHCPSSPSQNRKSINCAPSRHRHPISARMQPQPRTLSGSFCSSSFSFSSPYCSSYCSSSSFTSSQFYSVPPASMKADMRRRKPRASPGCSSLHQ